MIFLEVQPKHRSKKSILSRGVYKIFITTQTTNVKIYVDNFICGKIWMWKTFLQKNLKKLLKQQKLRFYF
jgi:hypothetical protein